MQRHERIASILARELRAGIERQPEWGGVRLDRDRRRLDLRAVGGSVLGIGFARQVALRPAVIAAILDDVDVLGRQVVAEVVAVVVAAPQFARGRIERQADGVAQSFREDPAARAVTTELADRRAQRIALLAEIAGRTDGEIQLAVRSEQDRAGGVTTGGNPRDDGHRGASTGIEPDHVALFGDVHRVRSERDSEWTMQAARDRLDRIRDAVVVRVRQLHDQPGSGLRGVDRIPRAEREIPHAGEALRKDGNVKAGRDTQRAVLSG